MIDNNKFEGCRFQIMDTMDDGKILYLVETWGNDGVHYGKLAFNTDDLQCDYEFDWEMPYTEDGDVYIVETSIVEDDDLKELFKYFSEEAGSIKNLYNEGVLTI